MQKNNITRAAQRNLKLLVILQILTMRTYLPLVTIYFTEVASLSVTDIGILASFIGVIQLVSEVPSGYFADVVSRKGSYLLGSVFAFTGLLVIIFFQNKIGIYIGASLEIIGYAFFSGTSAALIHDSLDALGKSSDYTKYASKIRSLALLANAGLIATVPLTYTIDKRLPFALGCLQFIALFSFSLALTNLMHKDPSVASKTKKSKRNWLRKHRKFILFAVAFGVFGATYVTPTHYRILALEEYGISASLLGFAFAAASLVGAAVGPFVHHMKKIPIKLYAALDGLIASGSLLMFISGDRILASIGFIISMVFFRYRIIVYTDHLLRKYTTKYKATLLSSLTNAVQLNRIWQPAAIGFVVGAVGLQYSFGYMALATLVIAIPFVLATTRTLSSPD